MTEVGGQVHGKRCAACQHHLPADSFNRMKASPDGLAYHCRSCANAKLNAWREVNGEHVRAYRKARYDGLTEAQLLEKQERQRAAYHANPLAHRDGYLQRTYGIDQAGYDEMLRAQGGRCQICASDEPGADRRFFAVDHNHKCCPGKKSCGKCVRGLLCMNCNQGLGKFRDDVNLMARAIAYLTEENSMQTTVNKDGSVTTTNDDEHPPAGSSAEAKVVESDEKPAAKTRSRAESK